MAYLACESARSLLAVCNVYCMSHLYMHSSTTVRESTLFLLVVAVALLLIGAKSLVDQI
jgi:hypothetical protein